MEVDRILNTWILKGAIGKRRLPGAATHSPFFVPREEHDFQGSEGCLDQIVLRAPDFVLHGKDACYMVTLPPNNSSANVPEGCRPLVLWLTGLPASGKSTLSSMLSADLSALGFHCIVLDGDRLRSGLCRDLGFTAADRSENIRRVGELARLLVDAGLIVITALISPYRADRDRARSLFSSDQFYEIYLQCPLDVCQQRDPKGLYRKAQERSIPFFTGLTDPYEPPTAPDLTLKTAELNVEESLRILEAFTLDRCVSCR